MQQAGERLQRTEALIYPSALTVEECRRPTDDRRKSRPRRTRKLPAFSNGRKFHGHLSCRILLAED
jgi:hypothetical protein